MTNLLQKILHPICLSTMTRQPIAGSSVRLVFDRLTGHQVLAADWDDISAVQGWLAEESCGGVYFLVGNQNGRLRVRVGEGVKLWNRLGDHRTDPQITGFVKEIYVLTSKSFNKSDVVYLQEQLSEIVQAEERIDWHKGCKHLLNFPLSEDDRKLLDLVAMLGLNLLHSAGLRVLQPTQSRLARQIAILLTQAGVR